MINLLSLVSAGDRISLRARQLGAMSELLRLNLTTTEPAIAAGGPVVSLTSFGKRARTVGFTVESIAQGNVRPSRLLLWLDEAALISQPSAMLARLQRRGVEILQTDDWGPHKKYYPYVASQPSFQVPLVTADDDVLYSTNWLATLVERYRVHPESVHCYRARVVGMNGERLAPYATWHDCSTTAPSHRHFSIGMAGVLLPPHLLQELQRRGTEFRSRCPRTDDIWLNLHAQRVGAKVQQVHAWPDYFMLLPGTQKGALLHDNVAGGNDSALSALYGADDLARLAHAA
jgi:hypothetical protein